MSLLDEAMRITGTKTNRKAVLTAVGSAIQSLLLNLKNDSRIWARASKLETICCSKGNPMPASDAIIAACGFVHDAGIEATDDRFSTLARYRDL